MNSSRILPCVAVVFVCLAVSLASRAQEDAGTPPPDKRAPEASGASSSLPPGLLARVDGTEITIEDYSRFLFARYGTSQLRSLISRVLVEKEATALEVEITPEDVETAVKARLDATLHGVFKGDVERMNSDLARRGLTPEAHRERLRQEVAYDLLRDVCIVKSREIPEKRIEARFEELYGKGGVRVELRHLLLEVPKGSSPDVETAKRQLARQLVGKIEGGADFVELVRQHSEDTLTRENDGRVPVYREGLFGDDFDAAVAALTEEKPVSGIIGSPRGVHIIALVRREKQELNDKREEIRAELAGQRPTTRERQEFLKGLWAKSKVER